MRLLRYFVALLLVSVAGGPRSSTLTPIVREMVTIRSVPVTLRRDDRASTRVGALTLLAGWKLSSTSAQFGGWSALHIDGSRVTMIGDYGSVLRFRLTQFGRAVEARIDPLPAGCGSPVDKRERDSESLAQAPDGWWIGYESHHRICRVSGDFTRALAVHTPSQMTDWRKSGGAEAMVRLNDGRVLVFAEARPRNSAARPLLVFAGDPTTAATPVVVRAYVAPDGYSPTAATQLPDGRILVLHRNFGAPALFTTVLSVIDPTSLETGAPVQGVAIARFVPPLLSDNYEGLAVTVEGKRPIVWMLSDDNFMGWQGSYLLKFALDPQPVAAAKPR